VHVVLRFAANPINMMELVVFNPRLLRGGWIYSLYVVETSGSMVKS